MIKPRFRFLFFGRTFSLLLIQTHLSILASEPELSMDTNSGSFLDPTVKEKVATFFRNAHWRGAVSSLGNMYLIVAIHRTIVTDLQTKLFKIKCFFFVYFVGGLECVGHSFASVAHFAVFRDVWIRTQRAAVPSRRTTSLATHLPN